MALRSFDAAPAARSGSAEAAEFVFSHDSFEILVAALDAIANAAVAFDRQAPRDRVDLARTRQIAQLRSLPPMMNFIVN
jgi:hypothetical protein